MRTMLGWVLVFIGLSYLYGLEHECYCGNGSLHSWGCLALSPGSSCGQRRKEEPGTNCMYMRIIKGLCMYIFKHRMPSKLGESLCDAIA